MYERGLAAIAAVDAEDARDTAVEVCNFRAGACAEMGGREFAAMALVSAVMAHGEEDGEVSRLVLALEELAEVGSWRD